MYIRKRLSTKGRTNFPNFSYRRIFKKEKENLKSPSLRCNPFEIRFVDSKSIDFQDFSAKVFAYEYSWKGAEESTFE